MTAADSAEPHPREALRRAEEAIARLETEQTKQGSLHWSARTAITVAIVLAVAGLVVHTFLEERSPQVDETSVLLLGLIVVTPFISKLKVLEIGGAKAEWRDEAVVGLKEIVGVLRAHNDSLLKVYDDLAVTGSDREPGPESELPPDRSRSAVAGETPSALRPLERILWVDDHPEGNYYERESLQRLVRIRTATSTAEALAVVREGAVDAVISDIVRAEKGTTDVDAGWRLADAVHAIDPRLPIFFYAGEDSVQRNEVSLTDAGADVVTSSFVELTSALRRRITRQFDEVVEAILSTVGVTYQRGRANRADYVIRLADGRSVVVETASWLRRPTADAFSKRLGILEQARTSEGAEEVWLVLQKDILTATQRAAAAARSVEILTIDEFRTRLQAP